MNYLNHRISAKRIVSILVLPLAVLLILPVAAQQNMPPTPTPQQQNVKEDYSTGELQVFIEANREASAVQQQGQGKMISAIEEEGLDVNTFNTIMNAKQNPQEDVQVSDGDLQKFDKAVEKVMVIQQNLEAEVAHAIENAGMEVDKYEEIMLAYQSSPKVQEKVHKILNEGAAPRN